MEKNALQKYLPLFIAGGLALIVVIYYVSSGQSSRDTNISNLEKSSSVQKVETKENNTVLVNCKNGESYQVVFQAGQTNYDNMLYDRCGASGAISINEDFDNVQLSQEAAQKQSQQQ